MFRGLSHNLYKVIDQKYATHRHFKNIIYDSGFLQRFGRHPNAYTGEGENDRISNLIYDHLQSNNIFKKINMREKDRGKYFAEKYRMRTWTHTFLQAESHNGEAFIVDGAYKQLFFYPVGHVDKWHSHYADFLSSLDPVFIGTPAELNELITKMKRVRDLDPLHRDDIWFPDWHFPDWVSKSRIIPREWRNNTVFWSCCVEEKPLDEKPLDEKPLDEKPLLGEIPDGREKTSCRIE